MLLSKSLKTGKEGFYFPWKGPAVAAGTLYSHQYSSTAGVVAITCEIKYLDLSFAFLLF